MITINNHIIRWRRGGKIKSFDLTKFVYPVIGILTFIFILGLAGQYDIRR